MTTDPSASPDAGIGDEPARSYLDFLRAEVLDPDTIQQAARFYVAERADDLTPEQMRQQLIEATGDEAEVDAAVQRLAADPRAVENIALASLAEAWREPGQAEVIRRVVTNAKTQLPVIETAAVCIAIMYLAYLVTTGNRKRSTLVVERDEQDRIRVRQVDEYHDPVGPLSVLGGMVDKWRDDDAGRSAPGG